MLERLNEAYGLNDPLWKQYTSYLTNVLQGDFGNSPRTGLPVLGTFLERFPEHAARTRVVNNGVSLTRFTCQTRPRDRLTASSGARCWRRGRSACR
mgnify:CR=1 FL=1